jgi:AcrR family transcriptional regulator
MAKLEVASPRGNGQSDRATQIIEAAARLFGQRGFHSVSLQDIGDEVGLDASSLYFHFPNKEAILVAVITWLIESGEARAEDVMAVPGTPEEHLRTMTEQIMRSHVGQRHYFLATPADLRLVPRPLVRELIKRRRTASQRRVESLVALHEGLTVPEAELMVDALACITVGLTHHRTALPKQKLVDLVVRMGLAATFVPPVDKKARPDLRLERGPADAPDRRHLDRGFERHLSSSRERILGDALTLFRRGGFDGVGVEAIAAASGITGPGVYRHFESKHEILETLFDRAIGELASSGRRAFEAAGNAREALDRLIDAYVSLAVEDSDLLAVFWTQRDALPRDSQLLVTRELRAFVKDWMGILLEVRADLEEEMARTMVYAALWIANSYWWYDSGLPVEQARPILRSMTANALLGS